LTSSLPCSLLHYRRKRWVLVSTAYNIFAG
jgi:hypothetical protein